jgi:hypothetical protein
MQNKRELREVQEQAQREVLTTSQQHLERELELQEQCKKEREFHIKSIEVWTWVWDIIQTTFIHLRTI